MSFVFVLVDCCYLVWLLQNTKYITDSEKLNNVYQYFKNDYLKIFDDYKGEMIQEKVYNEEKVKELMKEEGFIFL